MQVGNTENCAAQLVYTRTSYEVFTSGGQIRHSCGEGADKERRRGWGGAGTGRRREAFTGAVMTSDWQTTSGVKSAYRLRRVCAGMPCPVLNPSSRFLIFVLRILKHISAHDIMIIACETAVLFLFFSVWHLWPPKSPPPCIYQSVSTSQNQTGTNPAAFLKSRLCSRFTSPINSETTCHMPWLSQGPFRVSPIK